MKDAPIGIFDSGVGGLTVTRALLDIMPREEVLYVGDTQHTPYGEKSLEEVRKYSLNIMDKLAEEGVKMLVIACNTASAALAGEAQKRYQIPVVEVIQPAVNRAKAQTRNGKIGVLGTTATINSQIYQKALKNSGIEVYAEACPEFVNYAEAGITGGKEVLDTVKKHLTPMQKAQVDTLVLGCTHYPLLAGPISYIMGEAVQMISSSQSAANQVYATLASNDLLRDYRAGNPKHRFICTKQTLKFEQLAARIMGGHYSGIREEKYS